MTLKVFILTSIVAVGLASCSSANKTTESVTSMASDITVKDAGNECLKPKSVPDGFEVFDKDTYFIKYRNKIDKYDVKVLFRPNFYNQGRHSVRGEADLAFMIDGELIMKFRHPLFEIDSTYLNDSKVIELNYNFPKLDMSKEIRFETFDSLSFFFLDVNFDAAPELILNYPGQGQRSCHGFEAIGIGSGYEYNFCYDFTKDTPPFKSFDSLSSIDYTKQELSLFCYNYYQSVKSVFKKRDNQFYLDRYDDYIDGGYVLEKSRELKVLVDTITTFQNGQEHHGYEL